jgi:hypothetical protein
MFKIQPLWNILFINFSYMKISCILCVACYKFNGMPHCLIMKVKKVLNNFFPVYTISVTMIAFGTYYLTYFIMLMPQVCEV